jgi:hypothetical protein
MTSIVPQIPRYQEPEGIIVSPHRLQTARPTEGISNWQAQEKAMDRLQNAIDDIVEELWEKCAVWQIAREASKVLSIEVTPKHVYSSHLRTRREQSAIDTNPDEGAKE